MVVCNSAIVLNSGRILPAVTPSDVNLGVEQLRDLAPEFPSTVNLKGWGKQLSHGRQWMLALAPQMQSNGGGCR